MKGALLFLALVVAGPLTAQEVGVRTAEHDGFTRIVVDFRDRPEWRIEQNPGRLTLVTGRDVRFDLSDVYRRIGEQRVRTITQEAPGRLAIELACRCRPETQELRNEGLVIDVAPGAPDVPDLPFRTEDGIPVTPGLLSRAAESQLGPTRDRARTTLLSEEVTEALVRGVDQGLVEADLDTLQPPSGREEAPVQENPPAPGVHLRVTTQVERDEGMREDPGGLAPSTCPRLADLSLEEWGGPAAILYTEDGAPDPVAHAAEARRLIYQTFGAEAQYVLDAAPEETPERALLREIAGIVDGPAAAPSLPRVASCSPTLSLFSLVSGDRPTDRDLGEALGLFSDLPPHLRRHFGPRIIETLITAGDSASARIVRDAIRRGGGAVPDGALVDLSFPDAAPDTDREALEEIVVRRTPAAAEALGVMLDSMMSAGETVPVVLADQAMALAYEVGGAERVTLEQATISAEIAAGRFERAANRISDLQRLDAEAARALNTDLFGALLEIENDAEFITTAVRLSERAVPETAQAIEISQRLDALGVSSMAESYLPSGEEVPGRDERLLRARLAFEEGEPEIAESYLAGLEGSDVDKVRALGPVPEEVAPRPEVVEVPSLGMRSRDVLARSAALREELETMLAED